MNQPDEIHSEFERRLQEQYREAARETPPAALDKRILDAARAAAAEGPARGEDVKGMAANDFPVNDVAFHADRDDAPRERREEFRWGKPLALAAAVVLGLGIVVQVQMHRPDLSAPEAADKVARADVPAPAPAPAAAAPAAEPARDATRDDKVAAVQAPAGGMAAGAGSADSRAKDAAESVAAQRKAAAPREQEAPRQLAEAQAEKKASAYAGAPANQGARARGLDPLAQQELAKEEAAAKMRASAADELKRMEGGPQAQGTVLASNAAKPDAGGRTLGSAPAPAGAAAPAVPAAPAVAAAPPPPPPPAAPAPAPAPSAMARAQAPATAAAPAALARSAESSAGVRGTDIAAAPTPVYESDPDLWARRIIDMRKNGRNAQADSELKRLRARYPDFKLPAEALAPVQ
jgi:hypothetical protein